MEDRELLERAAKAAGYELQVTAVGGKDRLYLPGELHPWNPLTDDGDALRLAVKLMEDGLLETDFAILRFNHGDKHEDGDPYAATRRAIVRAAAALSEDHPK
jgi:hypothetical protein